MNRDRDIKIIELINTGMSYKQIAGIYDLSLERVGQISQRSVEEQKLKEIIPEAFTENKID